MHSHTDDPTTWPLNVQIIDDSDAPNATNFNTPHGGELNREAYLYARNVHPGANWKAQWSPSVFASGAQIEAAAWDPLTDLWLVAVALTGFPVNGATAYYGTGLDDGSFWTQIAPGNNVGGLNSVKAMAIAGDGVTAGICWAVSVETANLYVSSSLEVSGAWGNLRTVSVGNINDVELVTMANGGGGIVVYATGGTAASATKISYSTNGGSSWADNTVIQSYVPGGLVETRWCLKSNGSLIIAAPAFYTPTTPQLFTSPDGSTWTAHNLSFQGAHDQIQGLAWHPLANLWFMAMQTNTTSSPASCKFYSSPDGITWTQVGTGGPAKQTIADLEVVQNALVCTLQDQSSGGPAGQMFSPDKGVTWYPSQAQFPDNATFGTTGYIRSRLASSGTQLFAHNTTHGRFSHQHGLPPHL